MKKTSFLLAFSLLLLIATAQVNKSIIPVSKLIDESSLSPITEILLPPFNLTNAEQADITDAKNNQMPKFSRSVFTNITLDNSGSWTELPHGDRLWRVRVTSTGAQALLPYFNKFYLPRGATLHVYTPDKKEVIGAFTSANNPPDGYYATGLIHGESCILEYYEPKEVRGKGIISLNEVGHAYCWVNDYYPRSQTQNDTLGINTSHACEVNVNCSEGAAWQNQKRSVVLVIAKGSPVQLSGSGALINNVRQDCTPYILSAQHLSQFTSTNQYSQWLFYFNFESVDCSNPSAVGTLGNYFVTGCTKKADSNDSGGNTGSDFLLLQLNNAPPDSFNVYYSGWNRANSPSDSGVCIHHPNTDIKKISTYTKTLVDSSWGGTVSGTHWQVQWAATANGHGVTESGSSGSPLFNKQGQIIGQLTGGDSYCNLPDDPDLFGKVAYDWTSNGTTAIRQLQPWLDPDNTGAVSINGRNADCVLGIGETTNTGDEILVEVFPNPSSSIFNLNFGDAEEKTISVFDVVGRVIEKRSIHEKNSSINLSAESKGVYILQVETKNARAVKKLILNN